MLPQKILKFRCLEILYSTFSRQYLGIRAIKIKTILLLQSRVLANTDSGITDGCSPQVAVDHKGANLASVTETNISSMGVYVSGCWSSPCCDYRVSVPKG